MKITKKISILLFLFQVMMSFGQEIKKHQWEERVLILLTDDVKNSVYQKQLVEFNTEIKNFKERKLVVYRATPKFHIKGLTSTKKDTSTQLYKNYKKKKSSFEIILIGLDGGIKLRKATLLKKEDLNGLIDAMPMRRSELKKQ